MIMGKPLTHESLARIFICSRCFLSFFIIERPIYMLANLDSEIFFDLAKK